MQVRRIDMTKAEEALAVRRVEATAFQSPHGYRRLLQSVREDPQKRLPDPQLDDPARSVWGTFSGETLIAVATAITYSMLYEGRPVPMCGIAGVATLPEHRRRGAVRYVMAELLRDASCHGSVFSYLFPFSFAFYGKFGYGHGCRRYRVETPMARLRDIRQTGSVRAATSGDSTLLQFIYDQFSAGCNGAIVRSAGYWEKKSSLDRWSEQVHTFIWQDDSGQEQAFMTIETLREKATDTLQIKDWAALSPDGLIGLLAFLGHFADSYEKAGLLVPRHMDLAHFFPEPKLLPHKLETHGQIRILRIADALARLRQPAWLKREIIATARSVHDDWLSIRVTDDFLPENSGLYRLSFNEHMPAVQHLPDPSPVQSHDLAISARLLATLLLGSFSLAELSGHPECRLNPEMAEHRRDLLIRYFAQKKQGMYDEF